ncbi:MAG: signal recognition particle protein [Lachnospiraceae bacterium]|jgi:signal recognition particle subunit SRP54
MAFEGLSDKLQNIFRNLRKKGRLTEADVKASMKEIKMALLEADVNFKVVKQFTKSVQEKSIGQDVMNGLNPAQMVIKIVRDQMVELLGSEITEIPLKNGSEVTVIMMAGLQGAGKTTTAAKLAGKYKIEGKKPILAACDVYRPAAVEQLKINGKKQDVPVYSEEGCNDAVQIAKRSYEYARSNNYNILIIDTAGRLQIDEAMMKELADIKSEVTVDSTVLVIDAMTGQEAVNVAETFNSEVGIDGVILTKCDGDTRGGAALSVRAVTGRPILYVGMGEKLDDLEKFYPDRMTDRILGMGDVLTLIEKAQKNFDDKKAAELSGKLKKASFDFNDYLESMNQMKNMGGIGSVLSMMPGFSAKQKEIEESIDEKALARTEAIIKSMTMAERTRPEILNVSRKNRIAKGAGVDISEVNRLVKQFEQSKKMMKQLPGMLGGKGGRGGMFGRKGGFRLPF